MADNASENPKQRSVSDKDRSRQMSRPVSAREAARGRTAQPTGGKGQRPKGPQAQRGPKQATAGRPKSAERQGGRARQRPQRPPARRAQPASRTGRSRTALFTWIAVALVVVVVVVLVVVYATSSNAPSTKFTPKPVSATVLSEVTHVPASVYNKVGTGGSLATDIHPPAVETGNPLLKYTGKPGALGLFGEFCPYCAADRWSIVTALSRFGTFSGLKTMQSSSTDIDPNTPTFTFATTTYSSKYLAAKLIEHLGQDKPTGTETPLKRLTATEAKVVEKYDHAPTATTSSSSSGDSIPFLDFGNKVVFYEVSFTPSILATLSRATIAADLKSPSNPVTKLIIGASNEMSAAVCSIDGGKPGSVCSSAGVTAAAKALKLKV